MQSIIYTLKLKGFSGFVDNFSSVFDNIMGPFNVVAESLRQMSESLNSLRTTNVERTVLAA